MKDQWTDILRDLGRSLRGLEPDQGRIARRNARRRVRDDIARIQSRLAMSFPAIRKPVATRRSSTPIERKRRLRADGWVEIGAESAKTMMPLIDADVPIRIIRINSVGAGAVLVRPWAKIALDNRESVATLRRLKKSWQAQRAYLSKHAMKTSDDDGGATW